MSADPCPRAGAASEAVPGPVTATPKPKRPPPDQSWRAHHRERKAAWASPPVARFDYQGAMIAANRERNRQLAAARKAERHAQADEAARVFKAQVQPGFKPPAGRLWTINVEALLIIGPAGAIGTTAATTRILAPLTVGGRHDETGIAAATGCRDVAHLREVLAGISGKLTAIGLRVDRRKTGIRVAKARPPCVKPIDAGGNV